MHEITLRAGDTLYIGGNFTKIGNEARPGLAALDAEPEDEQDRSRDLDLAIQIERAERVVGMDLRGHQQEPKQTTDTRRHLHESLHDQSGR